MKPITGKRCKKTQ